MSRCGFILTMVFLLLWGQGARVWAYDPHARQKYELQYQINNLNRDIATLNNQFRDLIGKIKDAGKQATDTRKAAEEAKKNLQEVRRQVDEARKKMAQAAADLTALRKKLQDKLEVSEAAVAAKQAVSDADNAYETLKVQVLAPLREKSEYQIAALKLQEARTRLEALKNNLGTAPDRLAQASRMAIEDEAAVNVMEKAVLDADPVCTAAQTKLDAANKVLSDLQAANKKALEADPQYQAALQAQADAETAWKNAVAALAPAVTKQTNTAAAATAAAARAADIQTQITQLQASVANKTLEKQQLTAELVDLSQQ